MTAILKTLPPLLYSKKSCLISLMTLLARHSSLKLIRDLSLIGNILHHDFHSGQNSQAALIQEYGSLLMKADIQRDLAENRPTILFHPCSVKLLDELLRTNAVHAPLNLSHPPFTLIENLFLYANTLISYLEPEIPSPSIASYSEKNKIFYSRRNIDRVAAIGRFRMYDFKDFSLELKGIGVETEEYFKATAALCSHIETHPFIELEFPRSIKTLPQKSQEIIEKYVPILSTKLQSTTLKLSQLESKLSKLYFTDYYCRQKPLIQMEKRYYSFQPKLLWTALAELPFYLLLDSCKRDKDKVKDLGSRWGKAFEDNFSDLGRRVFGIEKCKGYKCQFKHMLLNLPDGHQIGDFLVAEDDCRILFELKGAQPTDEIKQGDRKKTIQKFIDLEKNKGVPQLVRDVEAYREETSYSGSIYIVLICWGPIPATKDFDADLQSYLTNLPAYQKHLANPQNKPLIYLDAYSAECLLGAIRQKLHIKNIFDTLAGVPPSKILGKIVETTQEMRLEDPLKHLYREEIERFAYTGRSLYEE